MPAFAPIDLDEGDVDVDIMAGDDDEEGSEDEEITGGAGLGSGVRKLRNPFDESLRVSNRGKQKMRYVGIVANE